MVHGVREADSVNGPVGEHADPLDHPAVIEHVETRNSVACHVAKSVTESSVRVSDIETKLRLLSPWCSKCE